MPLNTLDTPTLLQRQAAAIQSGIPKPINLNPGSVLLAFLESNTQVAMWLQSLVMQEMQAARLSTAQNTDVDSFVADFGLTRLPAVASTGSVTLSRITTTQQATIPAGSQVQTADGTQTFTIIADTTQSAWNASLNAYIIPVGTASITATVQAVNAGTQGNVLANTITVLTQPIQGVQSVTNPTAYSNGVNAEMDSALKARFVLYLLGLRAGIKGAVASAIAGLQQGIQYSLVENQTLAGATQNGYFYVIISPYNSTLQSQVYSAVDAIRPLGSTFGVFGASSLAATIAMTATPMAGYTHAQIVTSITAAIQAFIASIQLAQPLYWSQLYAVAYGVAGVQEVTNMTVNGGTADLVPTSQQIVTAGTITVN